MSFYGRFASGVFLSLQFMLFDKNVRQLTGREFEWENERFFEIFKIYLKVVLMKQIIDFFLFLLQVLSVRQFHSFLRQVQFTFGVTIFMVWWTLRCEFRIRNSFPPTKKSCRVVNWWKQRGMAMISLSLNYFLAG